MSFQCCGPYVEPTGLATGAAGGGGGVAISAGTQLATSGTAIFSNANGISFGMAGSASVTASFQAVRAVTAGTTNNATLTGLSFANGSGVSFGLNGATVTASVAAQTGTQAAIGAGTVTTPAGTIIFANGSGVTFGMNGSTVTASVAGFTQTPFGISAGTQSVSTGTVVFSNSNGLSFGMSGSSRITANYASYVSQFGQNTEMAATWGASINTLWLWPVTIPAYISATQVALMVQFCTNTNSSAFSGSSGAWTQSFGIYTLSGITAGLASSSSRQVSFTSGTTTSDSNQFAGMSGPRWRTIGGNYNLTPGVYLFAVHIQTSGGNGATVSLGGGGGLVALAGLYDGVETNQWQFGISASSFTSAMPASIAVNNTNYQRTGVGVRIPAFYLFGTT